VGSFAIIDALKEAEEPPFLIVTLVMPMIDERDDASDNLSILATQHRLALRIVIKRMRLEADQLHLINADWGNPIGVVSIQVPDQLHEGPLVAFGLNGTDLVIRHIAIP
jgi:hypothetical protein